MQRLIEPETHHLRMRMVGLVGTVGRIKFGAEIGLDHVHNPAGKAANRR
jgi:hypothetical protein